MTALKAQDIDAFVARPDPARPVILIYGPDAGLVRERAEKLIATAVDDPNDPFSMVQLDGDSLSSEPQRLVEEALTVPLFGGRRAIWIKPTSRNIASAVEALLGAPLQDCRVVIEAGDLKRNAPLRVVCEKAKGAAALPCYADGERDLARLVDDEMRAVGLAITPDARAALVALIGGDRRASRNEVRKLALYAHGRERVTLDDVIAVCADASALALDAVVDAAFAGRPGEAETQFAKALGAGTQASAMVAAALRHVLQLHKARLIVEDGGRTDEALSRFIPPLHFRRKPMVEAALANWTAARLMRAIEQLADATLAIRKTPALADAFGHRVLISLAQAARRRG